MKPLITQIHKTLLKNQKTVSVAESCTGGLVSKLLTDIGGSSDYFILGVVAYSNKTKKSFLRIPPSLILKNGSVSQQVAILMAKNIRKIACSDIGIGITGIAGPTGATKTKPVGMVFIAIESKDKCICKKFLLRGNRADIREKAAFKALELLKGIN